LELFAEYGVKGTTLHMIADRLEVTKAAVYYHFHTKDEIVRAVAQPLLEDIARVIRIADALPDPNSRREVAVSGFVELAVRHRGLSAIVQNDPAMSTLAKTHVELENAVVKLITLLDGPDADVAHHIGTSMIIGGVSGVVTDARLLDVPDELLHRVLLDYAQHLLNTPNLLSAVVKPSGSV